MGYLDNSSITVDAILTKRGRELLARNDGSFRITQFALGDDEVDYTLFNESHPNGTQYASEAIENMPLIEAIPDGSNSMHSKLITLARGTSVIPFITTSYPTTGISISQGDPVTLSPTTTNLNGINTVSTETYIFTIIDNRLTDSFVGDEQREGTTFTTNAYSSLATAESAVGTSVIITGTTSNQLFSTAVTSKTTSIIIEGRTSGARLTVPLVVNAK
tara:strand:+ start:1270 stop:1923 length:654 start_codon:yes stop_codon:yes gene_type:complete